MNENKRKSNKSPVIWPTSTLWTFEDLFELNKKDFIRITLRTRLTEAREGGKVAYVGTVPGGKGAPPKVYSLAPVTQNTVNKVRAAGMTPADDIDRLIQAVSITPPRTTPAVNPASVPSVKA